MSDGLPCHVISLPIVSYREGMAWQKKAIEKVAAGAADLLLLLEHYPVLTIGRSGNGANLLVSGEVLAGQGIELYEVERGGDITYHGPGQLVGYPVFDLNRHGRDVRLLLRRLEEAGLCVLARFGIAGRRDPRYTGVWAGEEKVMAIGVAVRKWVSYHGFALNIDLDLASFRLINPCGIKDKGVTSIAKLLGRPVARAEVEPVVVEEMGKVFNLSPRF